VVAQLLTRLRRGVDIALAPRRRARALARLRALPGVGEILVLCQGNICRSPYAAEVLGARLGGHGILVRSAGFLGPGRSPPPHAITAARIRGVDLAPHRSCTVAPPLLRAADLIVVMEPAHRSRLRFDFGIPDARILILGDLDPGPPDLRGITDPWDRPLEVFAEVYSRIERCTAELARLVTGEGDGSRRVSPRNLPPAHRSASAAIPRSSTAPGRQSSQANSS
jgi:protein-tyrosine-phosphatase